MRHVDDTHQTKGDRQAKRREQQYAAKANPEENIADPTDNGLMPFDLSDGGLCCRTYVCVRLGDVTLGVGCDHRGQKGLEIRIFAVAQQRYSAAACRGITAFNRAAR